LEHNFDYQTLYINNFKLVGESWKRKRNY